MGSRIEVVREAGVRFRTTIGDHAIVFDQPVAAGGTDLGPTPTDAFVASIAGCVAYYVERFLERHAVSADGLRVGATFSMAAHPSRVASIELSISLTADLPDALREPLMAVARHCTVHNSIHEPPELRIALAPELAPAVAGADR